MEEILCRCGLECCLLLLPSTDESSQLQLEITSQRFNVLARWNYLARKSSKNNVRMYLSILLRKAKHAMIVRTATLVESANHTKCVGMVRVKKS